MNLSVIIACFAIPTTAIAYDFHDKQVTPDQDKVFEQYMRSIIADPAEQKTFVDEHRQRKTETIKETAFRHMVTICEDLQTDGAVAKCNAAVYYYKTLRDDKNAND